MKHALVVDDTAVDRRLAGGLIEQGKTIQVTYAEDGAKALELIELCTPDVVVTDLQMPVMDGLQLVEKVREAYPDLPVILMTARGSESVAVEALERGAAGYVPKSQLNERIRTTVEDILRVAQADRSYAHLAACQKRAELCFELTNDYEVVDALVDLVQKMMDGMGLTDSTGRTRSGVALREALLNAMYHGNLEATEEEMAAIRSAPANGKPSKALVEKAQQAPYCDRRMKVDVCLDRNEARFVIEDQGKGFNYADQLMKFDPGSIASLDHGEGRGFVLMMCFMDEISFNESGNRVTLVKRRDESRRDESHKEETQPVVNDTASSP